MLHRSRPLALIRWDDLNDAQLVDYVRAGIGLKPIPCKKHRGTRSELPAQDAGISRYLTAESLQRLADPQCRRCGGSGTYDGWHLDMRCPCTGLPAAKVERQLTKSPNPAFARRRA